MPEFMVMVLADEADESRLAPSETKALVEGHSAYERELRSLSAYLDGERLRPSAEGRRVRLRDGEVHIDEGPFETALTAYYLLSAESLDAAVALTKHCPMSPGTTLDVRPVMALHHTPSKASQPGRVFAFAVLGDAATEQDWVEVMDRIDQKTRAGFPGERWLGGLRLHAPSRGRHVTSTAGQRAVFDGPFMESKEVIGGAFFMRMTSLDEAVRWASQTAFVTEGALEIRELWRS